MKLDYIPNINEFGDHIVRLYDFDHAQAVRFKKVVEETMITAKSHLDLKTVDFIEARNCNLILRLSDEDLGIITSDHINFYCDLTEAGYEHMISLLEPFCKRETKGYQFLYDVDTHTDLLFSPAGTW